MSPAQLRWQTFGQPSQQSSGTPGACTLHWKQSSSAHHATDATHVEVEVDVELSINARHMQHAAARLTPAPCTGSSPHLHIHATDAKHVEVQVEVE